MQQSICSPAADLVSVSVVSDKGQLKTELKMFVCTRALHSHSTEENTVTPHLPIIADLNIATHDHVKCKNRAAVAISRHDRLKWDSEERNYLYRALLSSRLSAASACTADDLDELAKFVASSIHAAARHSGCARPSRPPKAWWTPSISAARD